MAYRPQYHGKGATTLEIAMIRLMNVFHDHCESDKKLNKAELRKLLDEGLVIYQTIVNICE